MIFGHPCIAVHSSSKVLEDLRLLWSLRTCTIHSIVIFGHPCIAVHSSSKGLENLRLLWSLRTYLHYPFHCDIWTPLYRSSQFQQSVGRFKAAMIITYLHYPFHCDIWLTLMIFHIDVLVDVLAALRQAASIAGGRPQPASFPHQSGHGLWLTPDDR